MTSGDQLSMPHPARLRRGLTHPLADGRRGRGSGGPWPPKPPAGVVCAFYDARRMPWFADGGESLHFARNVIDEIHIGLYGAGDSGGTLGEFTVAFLDLRDGHGPAPRLLVFQDAWQALIVYMPHLLERLAYLGQSDEPPTKDEFVDMLLDLGFVDRSALPRDAA